MPGPDCERPITQRLSTRDDVANGLIAEAFQIPSTLHFDAPGASWPLCVTSGMFGRDACDE